MYNIMKRSIYPGLIALFVCALSACDSYNYYQAAINKTNMSGYHSFAWMPSGTKINANQQADMAIKTSTTTALQGKGLALQQQKPQPALGLGISRRSQPRAEFGNR